MQQQKNNFLIIIFALIIIFLCSSFKKNNILSPDILIIGGGASGISAGIQSSRLGAKTVIIEESSWLGGMLTAAGVSAIDGNDKLPNV